MNKTKLGLAVAAVLFSSAAMAANDWSGIVSASVGNDDNVTLGDDSNVQASNEGDNFLDILATAGTYLKGDKDDGFRVNGTFYNRAYDTQDDFNFTLAAAGIAYHKKLGDWHGRFGAKYSYIEFGGDPYESVYDLTAEGRHKLSKTTEIRVTVTVILMLRVISLITLKVIAIKFESKVVLRPVITVTVCHTVMKPMIVTIQKQPQLTAVVRRYDIRFVPMHKFL